MASAERRRQATSAGLESTARARWGQYFTPAPTAEFMAAQFDLPAKGAVRLLDPGAGTGSLTCAVISRILRERPGSPLAVTVCEIDPSLHAALSESLAECARAARAARTEFRFDVVRSDFIDWAARETAFGATGGFDFVVMNPPYRKLGRGALERRTVALAATDVSNVYAAFLALGVQLLSDGGQLVAITPRSFTNGPYFKGFRRFFLDRMDVERLHVYQSRTSVFADTEVLQENVVLTARRTDAPARPDVTISVSRDHADEPACRTVRFAQVVHPDDEERFWHIDVDHEADRSAVLLTRLPATLADLGVQVSTGRVVDFRAAEHLHADPLPGDVPLIYPFHLRAGRVRWPVPNARKCNGIALNAATAKLTFPRGHYAVVKRLSSKEERRRVVAALFDPRDVDCAAIGFENHVNVLHGGGAGLEPRLARGLVVWLNSTALDNLVRRFSGHTQVNATDLRNLRYPALAELAALADAWDSQQIPEQAEIDALVSRLVSSCSDIPDTLPVRD